uniref:Gag n=1 Tax=Haliotis discus hannai TaxID=42344 RepID=A0A289ZMX2_HALDH|nr:Gag [Haliotis discus hannai]
MSQLSSKELDSFLESFKKLGVIPKGKTEDELREWVTGMIAIQGATAGPSASHSTPPTQSLTGSLSVKQPPRVSVFSGDPTAKGETPFDVWLYEVDSLSTDLSFSEEEIKQSLRRALRGDAARIVMRLGHSASVNSILTKLKSVYSSSVTEQGEALMAQFYSARQGDKEDATKWGCRLEDMLDRLVTQGHIQQDRSSSVLCTVFWSGLRQDLKDSSGHKFDTINDFDKLRVAVRRIEYDQEQRKLETQKKSIPAKALTHTEPTSEVSMLIGMVNQLSAKIDNMETKMSQMSSSHSPQLQQNRQVRFTDDSIPKSRNKDFDMTTRRPPQDFELQSGVQCYRCGQYGHISRGCRVRLDHLRRGNLNGRGPMSRGRH